VLGKLGSPIARFPKFAEWIFPRWLGLGTLGVMLVSMISVPPWLSLIITNLFYVGSLLLALEGLALAWYLISKLTAGNVVKVVLLMFLFLTASWLLIWVGFADNFADYRGLRR